MRLINEAGQIQASTAPVTLGDLAGVDAMFAANAAVGVRSVSTVNGIQWADDHPVLDTLRRQYADIPPEPL